MYQPLIKFHPYPAIITQVLSIFSGSNIIVPQYGSSTIRPIISFHLVTRRNVIITSNSNT